MLLINIFLLLLSNGLTIRKDVSILYSRIAILILIYSIIATYESYYITYIANGLGLFNGLFNATAITQTFQNFIFIAGLVILIITSFHLRKVNGYGYGYDINKENLLNKLSLIINKMAEQYTIIEYALIILFVIMGGSLLLSSGDYISLFLCIELQSYGLYILCVIYRNSESATSSGLTYFLLGGLSSCFILLGIVFVYVNGGVTSLDSFFVLTNLTTSSVFESYFYNSQYITYSLLIMSVGLLFKIGAAPFHFWSPDVYDGIPTIVTTFVANMAKISILILMLEIIHYTSETLKKATFDWTTGILVSCLLSLIIGTILGLTQTRIKRLLAYSTISHLGFILLALSVNTIESSKAFIFYLMQYTISNINAFIILIAIGVSLYLYVENKKENVHDEKGKVDLSTKLKDKNNSPIQLISQIKGYFYINPFLGLSFGIIMLSFVGLPPLIGFFAKQMILSSALDNSFVFLVLVSVITSVIGAVYYLGIIKTMFFEKSDYKKIKSYISYTLSNNLSVPVSVITLIIILYILIANEYIYLCNNLSNISYSDNLNS